MVSAELPAEEEDAHLRELVLKFNQHPRNHLDSPMSRCYKDGRCIYDYPQPLREANELSQFMGKVLLRRRKEEDRWTVPYMPYLLKLLECHVNVEITSTVNVFLYLYKYLFKGPDRTLFAFSENGIDEAKEYIKGRYLSSSEAAWRIFQFDVTTKEPSVLNLRVHLPERNLHQMYRTKTLSSEASDLLRYFARPANSIFDNITFQQYFRDWRFICSSIAPPSNCRSFLEVPQGRGTNQFPQKRVIERTNRKPVTRLATVSVKAGELFYLRAILAHKAGRSYKDLRTVEGQVYPTFHDAAKAMHLFDSEDEPAQALAEAVANHRSPPSIRFLFAQVIITFPTGDTALTLFQRYQDALTVDFVNRTGSAEIALNQALNEIGIHLAAQGGKLSDYGLPDPGVKSNEVADEYALFEDRVDLLLEQSYQQRQLLNPEQLLAYQTILCSVYSDDNICPIHHRETCRTGERVFFLDGKAGRGKTFVINTIVNHVRGHERIVLIAGSTALSVTLYEGGRTAHNLFGIPVSEVSTFFDLIE